MALKIDPNTLPVISALVAAVSGMMVSIYAGIVGTRNSKKVAALQSELDKHKQISLEYLRTYMTLEIDERNRSLEGFKQLIRSVQILRDKMKRVVEFPHSFSPDILEKELEEICSSISEAYASNQIFFPDDCDRTLAHSLKNKCISAAEVLPQFLRGRDLAAKLDRLQKEIADDQQSLRMRARHSAELMIAEAKGVIAK